MTSKRIAKLVSLGKMQGRDAARKIADESFAAIYESVNTPGIPLSAEQEMTIRADIEKIVNPRYDNLRPPSHIKLDETELALFVQARRTEFLKYFMDTIKTKWNLMVTQ